MEGGGNFSRDAIHCFAFLRKHQTYHSGKAVVNVLTKPGGRGGPRERERPERESGPAQIRMSGLAGIGGDLMPAWRFGVAHPGVSVMR
jgi:hypothetical protein